MNAPFTQYLYGYIHNRKGKVVSLNKVHELAEKFGVKQRTAERKLNKGIATHIETLYDEKGRITGYHSLIGIVPISTKRLSAKKSA